MSRPELHTSYQRTQLDRLDKAMAEMTRQLIPLDSTPFRVVWEARAKLESNLGFRLPRDVLSLVRLFGLSPGSINLFLDSENGWIVEARESPTSPPRRRIVDDTIAMRLIKGELDHPLEEMLMAEEELPDN